MAFTEAYAGPPAVLVDELNARGFKRAANGAVIWRRHRRVPLSKLSSSDCCEPPRLFGVEPPRPRIEAVRIVDMSSSNSWAELAGVFRSARSAFLEHERAKAELKGLVPEDAKEAVGHGVRAKRSKSGAISFDLMDMEAGRQPCSAPVNPLGLLLRR
jgi:hypothetical protein